MKNTLSIFNNLRPLTVGFDDMFEHFEHMMDDRLFTNGTVGNFPPYNIVKTGKHTYNIELALAGFNKKDIEVEVNEDKSDETMKAELEGKIDDDMKKMFLFLENKVKLLENKIQMDIDEVRKIATGKRGDELDKEKYKMLVSEYRKFKTKNVKHFRFNSEDNLSTFGK